MKGKNLVTGIFGLIFSLFIFSSCSAPKPQIGFYNSQEVLAGHEDVPRIEATLEEYVKTLENEFAALKAEQADKQKKFSADSANLSGTVLEYSKKQLDEINAKVADYPTEANKKFAEKRMGLYAGITTKLEDILKEVAKKKGYTYILETSTIKFAYADSANDLTTMIKSKFMKK